MKQKFGDINPDIQSKNQNVGGRMLSLKVCNVKYFGKKIYYN